MFKKYVGDLMYRFLSIILILFKTEADYIMKIINNEISILDIFRTNRCSKGLICAHCQSEEIILYGTYNKKQRYKSFLLET